MKVMKTLLGLLFGAWAIGTLVLGLSDLKAPISSSAGLSNLAAVVGATAILAMISAWSFQSAFRKPQRSQDEREESNATNTEQV